MQTAVSRYPNVEALTAYMPEAFGTHHSKMMILFRHNDTAQVIIHTANMISQDWLDMCQGIWRSPLLPFQPQDQSQSRPPEERPSAIGTGSRFKSGLIRYLKHYGKRTSSLVDQLTQHDFSSVKAAFIASVPKRIPRENPSPAEQTSWGWPGLKEILSSIPRPQDPQKRPHVVAQVSSIATLSESWVTNFLQDVLGTTQEASSSASMGQEKQSPDVRIMFPTPQEIRCSTAGYTTGSSIHCKLDSPRAQKQWELLRPKMVHWTGPQDSAPTSSEQADLLSLQADPSLPRARHALRSQAAPHIKTYTRFSDASMRSIDWAMLTSANLSTQAWGDVVNKEEEVRICSYEVGVVVWPALFGVGNQSEEGMDERIFDRKEQKAQEDRGYGSDVSTESGDASTVDEPDDSFTDAPCHENKPESAKPPRNKSIMVPLFGYDTPQPVDCADVCEDSTINEDTTVVGLRMPYDIPFTPYALSEDPWCPHRNHLEPDDTGRVWRVS